MGVIRQGILGGFSGKVGSVTGSSWKGIAVIKSRPLSVANPRTSGQVAQRSKLSTIVDLAKPLVSPVIKPLWDRFAVKQSGYNAFVQANMAFMDVWSSIEFNKLVISNGKMSPTSIDSAGINLATKVLSVAWSYNVLTDFQLITDKAYVTIINVTRRYSAGFATSFIRSDGEATIYLSTDIAHGDEFYVYLSFARVDGTVVSGSSSFYFKLPD